MRRIYIPKSGSLLLSSQYTSSELFERLQLCGVPTDWGWNFCRTAGCHRCRKHRVKAWIAEAVRRFASSEQRNMLLVTVMLDPVADVGDIKRTIHCGKVAWRNLIYRLRQADDRANALQIIGVAEVDWYHASDVHRLSSYKRTQLDSLGFDVTAEQVWMPHFHLVVDLAGLPRRKLEEALLRQWPGARQVDAKPLDVFYAVERNLTRVLTYATKHKHFYKIDPFHESKFVRWPEKAVVSYYNMLFDAGGFSLLRFNLKPKKKPLLATTAVNKRQYRDPMPLILW